MGTIYGLVDPTTLKIRYIGQTIQKPKNRYHQHLYQWKRSHKLSHVNAWIKSLSLQNLKPILSIVESEIDPNSLNSKEIYYIKQFRELKEDLTNIESGGNQSITIVRHNKNSIEKRLNSLKTSESWKIRNIRHAEIIKELHKSGPNKIGFRSLSKERLNQLRAKGQEKHKKPVCSLSDSGEIIKTFKSIKEAAEYYSIPDSTHIVKVCKGKSKKGKTFGIIFKYL